MYDLYKMVAARTLSVEDAVDIIMYEKYLRRLSEPWWFRLLMRLLDG